MNSYELAVIMPVYNEEGAIEKVLNKWQQELHRLKIDFKLHVYNDGSKDNTLNILKNYGEGKNEIIIHNKSNSGHGPTILLGYRENSDAEWIFQIDSDDEMGIDEFESLWKERENHDFLIGRRNGRKSPLPRKIISFISRTVVRFFYGRGIWDVNSPYRLMRSDKFKEWYLKIPEDTFAPNVIISGIACMKKYSIFESMVKHTNRITGEVSIKKLKLLKAALRSFLQTINFRVRIA